MGVNYSKIFTATDAVHHEPFTILVETINPIGGENFVVLKALEGKYETREDFQDARAYAIKGWEKGYTHDKGGIRLCSSITMLPPGIRQLVDALNEALSASEEFLDEDD